MPRMLVPPRHIGDGDLRGCTGATMEDGTVYRANKRGHIDNVPPEHAKAMVKSGHVLEAKFHGGGLPGATCTGCGRSKFAWQASAACSWCGGEIVKDQEEES